MMGIRKITGMSESGQLSGDAFATVRWWQESHSSISLREDSGYSECWIIQVHHHYTDHSRFIENRVNTTITTTPLSSVHAIVVKPRWDHLVSTSSTQGFRYAKRGSTGVFCQVLLTLSINMTKLEVNYQAHGGWG